jgi:transcriptional regulator with XRE-family HTH domain
MVERIKEIILKEGLTSGSFADLIGVQRSSMSHILNGRNNPSLDFVIKTLQAFPKLNPEWLLTGVGVMYRTDETSQSKKQGREQRSIFDEGSAEPATTTAPPPEPSLKPAPEPETAAKPAADTGPVAKPAAGPVPREAESAPEPAPEKDQAPPPAAEPEKPAAKAPEEQAQAPPVVEPPVVHKQIDGPESVDKQPVSIKISQRYVNKVYLFYSDHTYDEFLKAEETEN